MILYKKGNLFDAPKGSILAHACNCKGVWGSGIAKQFRNRFPVSYIKYKEYCEQHVAEGILGTSVIFYEDGYYIACMFTSDGYGSEVDTEELIIKHTDEAVFDVLSFRDIFEPGSLQLHMPKINSGKFGVPWEKTEPIIGASAAQFNTDIVVWEPTAELKVL